MAVLSDLSGNPAEPLPPVADRKFADISVDNFDDCLKAMKPRVAISLKIVSTEVSSAKATAPSMTPERELRWVGKRVKAMVIKPYETPKLMKVGLMNLKSFLTLKSRRTFDRHCIMRRPLP